MYKPQQFTFGVNLSKSWYSDTIIRQKKSIGTVDRFSTSMSSFGRYAAAEVCIVLPSYKIFLESNGRPALSYDEK